MSAQLLTVEHEYAVTGPHHVLEAAGGIPIVEALDAATSRLEAAVAGLRDLMGITECSDQATLVFYAAESALALIYASHAGLEAAGGDQ